MGLPVVKEVVTLVTNSGAGGTITTSSDVTTSDFLVLYHTVPGHTGTKPTPSGGGTWTGQEESQNTPSDKMWTRPVVSGGVQTVTVSGVSSRRQTLTLLVLSGVDLSDPVNEVAKSGSILDWTSSHYSPNLTTTEPNCLVVRGWQAQDSGNYSTTVPSGCVARSLLDVGGPDARVVTQAVPNAGSTGTKTISYSTNSPWETIAIAIKGSVSVTHQAALTFDVRSSLNVNPMRIVYAEGLTFDVDSGFNPQAERIPPQTHESSLTFRVDTALKLKPAYTPPTPAEVARRGRAIGLTPTPQLRFYAQRISSGLRVDSDLELVNPEITFTLSGPNVLRATVSPERKGLLAADGRPVLQQDDTWIFLEDSGQIRGVFMVTAPGVDDQTLSFTALGFSGYAHGQGFVGDYTAPFEGMDPATGIRVIWQHLEAMAQAQGRPMGITVNNTTTPVRINTPKVTPALPAEDGMPAAEGSVEPDPYILKPYDGIDCGAEIDNLAKAGYLDYVEYAAWNADKSDTLRVVELYYPRVGRKRTDLRFADGGENIIESVAVNEAEGSYASEVLFIGSGDGSEKIWSHAVSVHPFRVRYCAIVTDSGVTDKAKADRIAAHELAKRMGLLEIKQLVIDAWHRNAPLGSYIPGDDIIVTCTVPFWGELHLSHRIVSYTFSPATDTVTLDLVRSESFTYGAPGEA